MKTTIILILFMMLSLSSLFAQGYKVGDKAADFNLTNIDGKKISLYNYKSAEKGAIVIFTCNHCPYAKAYEDRIIELDKEFKAKGFPVIAINSNDPELAPEDSYDKMIIRANEKGFTFPYLFDSKQEVYKIYGAKRTPHVYLLEKNGGNFIVKYIGAIDDNYNDVTAVDQKYVSNAVNSLLSGKNPDPNFTKAIGCTIKDKNYLKE
ncbi:MAG: redoxin [Bacteroidetes bacterium GWA2_31_9b]|nr:MAG: redoxin [Bacteroidetes bacterium GWA2_31_9b]